MRGRLFALALIAIVPLSNLSAQRVRHEARDLRQAKRELQRDVVDRRQAARAGNERAVRRETREIQRDKRDIRQERRDLRRAAYYRWR